MIDNAKNWIHPKRSHETQLENPPCNVSMIFPAAMDPLPDSNP